jgi:Fe(3+) dicitrate transport protein
MTKLGNMTRNPNGSAAVVRYRSNIGGSNLWFWNHVWLEFKPNFLNKKNFIWNVFSNIALTDSQYLKSDAPNIEGNKVEFVPLLTLRQEREWL